jgi:hypothetical protein
MVVRLIALRVGRSLLPRNIIFLLLVLVSVKAEPQGLLRLEGLGKLKKKKLNYLVGSRTRDLPACSIMF